MSDFHNRSQTSARRSDYVWQYEYYDDEEPVSFEGLKAHRCKRECKCVHYEDNLSSLLLPYTLCNVFVRAFECTRVRVMPRVCVSKQA